MKKNFLLLIVFFLFFGVLAPIIHAQTVTSNTFCTKVGNADDAQNPCRANLGNLTFYCQKDSRWATHPYVCSTMPYTGCGPTTMAMVLSAYGSQLTPPQIADMYTTRGLYVCGPDGGTAMETSLASQEFKNALGIEVGPQLVSGGRLDMQLAQQFLSPSSGYVIIGSSNNFPSCSCGHIYVVQTADPATGIVGIRDPINCSSSGVENESKINYQMTSINWRYAFPVKKVR